MRGRPIRCSERFVVWWLAATLLAFAALPALHGAHAGSERGNGPAALEAADGAWTAADADCPLCRGLVRARVAPAPPQGEFQARAGSLPVADRCDRVVPGDAPRTQRARAPPAHA